MEVPFCVCGKWWGRGSESATLLESLEHHLQSSRCHGFVIRGFVGVCRCARRHTIKVLEALGNRGRCGDSRLRRHERLCVLSWRAGYIATMPRAGSQKTRRTGQDQEASFRRRGPVGEFVRLKGGTSLGSVSAPKCTSIDGLMAFVCKTFCTFSFGHCACLQLLLSGS